MVCPAGLGNGVHAHALPPAASGLFFFSLEVPFFFPGHLFLETNDPFPFCFFIPARRVKKKDTLFRPRVALCCWVWFLFLDEINISSIFFFTKKSKILAFPLVFLVGRWSERLIFLFIFFFFFLVRSDVAFFSSSHQLPLLGGRREKKTKKKKK
jgi:hypothetical protein